MTTILASPPPVRVSTGSAWPGVQETWTGWDGSVWDLTAGLQGVTLLKGARGYKRAGIRRYSSELAQVAGSRHRGHRVLDGDAFWPVRVATAAGSQAWVDLDAAWWRTMRTDTPGMWTVTGPGGQSRSLMLRYAGREDEQYVTHPAKIGRAVYGIHLVADDPFWTGAPILSPLWKVPGGKSFIPTAAQGGALPFRISPAQTAAAATLTNPGDVDAWPVWTITGETTDTTTITVDGRTLGYPALADGQSVRIDTDPRRQTARREDGSNVAHLLTEIDFAPIPPGVGVQVEIELTGAGSVQGSFTPRYLEAW